MKTLQKLTLLAFAVLSAGAANAQTQCLNCTPPAITQPPHRTEPGCRNCSTSANYSVNRLRDATLFQPGVNVAGINSSSVYQRGTNQYACVEQVFGDNVATLVQDAGSATARGRNDAYQYQYNPTSVDNVMYGSQTGSGNFLIQRQAGSGNLARASQTGSGNIAGQSQGSLDGSGLNNNSNMYLRQQSDDNISVQYQRGNGNTSDVAQYNRNGSWSATAQLGSNNTVVVNQH